MRKIPEKKKKIVSELGIYNIEDKNAIKRFAKTQEINKYYLH